MINRIESALAKNGVTRFVINETVEESAELFFVKHTLDQRRIKDTRKYSVSVFREGEKNGTKCVGSTNAEIIPSMTDEEIDGEIKSAYFAAQFALNPDYKPADKNVSDTVKATGELAEIPLYESAGKMAKAIFAADSHEKAFINSAEVFCHRYFRRTITSEGTDVSYISAVCKGEFCVQCKDPEDVELFTTFEFCDNDTESLTKQVREELEFVYDRARAVKALKSGKYDIILSGSNLAEILSYYTDKSSASMIYPKYSPWNVGDKVQGDVKGDKIGIRLESQTPFSADGIATNGLEIIKDGELENIHGATRFCRYLGIEPTGIYNKTVCTTDGSVSFEDMKKNPCLWAVAFSDFQMDAMTGRFGGEIRLAYLFDGEKVTPVTGGSINGSLIESQDNIVFSKEKYFSAKYDGPYAAKFKSISVAGTVSEGEISEDTGTRTLTIKREKTFVACLAKMKIHVEDHDTPDNIINNIPCRFIGEIKNGEEKQFCIGKAETRVFAIADNLSKNYCNDYAVIPAGSDPVYLSGKNKYNPANGNAFRFNGEVPDEVMENRKKSGKKGTRLFTIIIVIAAIIGFAAGLIVGLLPADEKVFTKENVQITLTEDFEEKEYTGYCFAYESDPVFCVGFEETFEDYPSLEDWTAKEYASISALYGLGEDKSTEKDDLVYFDYTQTVSSDVYHYYAFVYKTDKAFYTIQFVCLDSDTSKYESDIFEYAKSVKFN